jgi:hypothetical protein
MRWRTDETRLLSTEEAFRGLTIEHLKPLVELVADEVPKRKPELVAFLTNYMKHPENVRALYEGLEPLGQLAVREAAHDPKGSLNRDRFIARHGRVPQFEKPDPNTRDRWSDYYGHRRPTTLRLFFPKGDNLPTDLRALLLTFVPPPAEFTLPTLPEPPATVTISWRGWSDSRSVRESEEVPLRVRETAREALHDVRAVLRLVEAGRVRVSDKKKQPTAASMRALADVLQGGDFYTAEDQDERDYHPSHDLAIKAFAWPMIVQAAGLAQKTGDELELTPAGRKALSGPAPEVLRAAWKKWRVTNLLDEFSRVEAIKGQGKGGLSALADRRRAVLDGLVACPAGAWFAVDDFFRFLRATDRDFTLSHRPHELYIAEHYYGNLGDVGDDLWYILQGRYILAVLFEYAATLGLIDVGYLAPQGARDDYTGRWGTDEYEYLSRYDGLKYVRINALGAWLLGQAERYEPPAPVVERVLQVLPNLEVVVRQPPLAPSDRLVLERFAEPQSEGVWRLTADKAPPVLEEGGALDELEEFLAARSAEALPQPVQVFLADLRRRAGRLRDLGLARLVECADAGLARELAADPQLRGKAWPAGERWLVFRTEDEAAVRKALKRLGHVLPPSGQ